MKLATCIAAALIALAAVAAEPPAGTIQAHEKTIVWKDAPPSLTKGSKIAVMEGNPKTAGMFTMRLQIPAGGKVPPHWHPRPERVTILSGEVRVGFGDKWDDSVMTSFVAGDFYVNPPNSHHFVFFPVESVIQITGEGPWELNVLE